MLRGIGLAILACTATADSNALLRGGNMASQLVANKQCKSWCMKDFKKGKARPTTNDESKLFDMVVCQADKRVVCKPLRAKTRTSCRTTTTAKAVARCPFDVKVWNLGGTCIASHVHKLKGSPCTTNRDAKLLRAAKCSQGTQRDHIQCSRLAMSF